MQFPTRGRTRPESVRPLFQTGFNMAAKGNPLGQARPGLWGTWGELGQSDFNVVP